ncbi:ABC transporter ATP-binding protein [Frankia sp. AgB32]|uniref:ABC transporter ATP-binding protein n=1 Tax=Frankia sp. AgB32 TaxID=631119 RepID=UPI00200BADD3|nr:ABC transporter ATP-binding protein [Frankia sp. AgB32]MCK9893651.1 ABC transporter ATP-binding protein [Frankia sp. AgB32]
MSETVAGPADDVRTDGVPTDGVPTDAPQPDDSVPAGAVAAAGGDALAGTGPRGEVGARTAIGSRGEAVGIELRELRRAYGEVTALDGLSVTINPGELVALLGPSGCGKTTALRALAGFERPDSGQILVGGDDITAVPANRRDMGMVFQAYSLFPNLTALDNVAFGLRLRRVNARTRRRRAAELLELVGLGHAGRRYPHELSGGQQQRVALARALAIEPRVLLLDEPLSALDAQVRASLRDEIRALQTRLGITTLFVTHDQEEALSLADRVGVMRAGRLEQLAAPEVVYAWPATPFVAQFVGTVNRLPGRTVGGDLVEVLGQRLPAVQLGDAPAGAAATADVEVLVRPEAVVVTARTTAPAGASTGALGQVRQRTFRGAVTRLRVDLVGPTAPDAPVEVDGRPAARTIVADIATAQASGLAPGSEVLVTLAERPVLVSEPADR